MSNKNNCPLDVDVKNKLSTVGKELENDIKEWIEGLIGEKLPDPSFGKSLKNGIILCNLANKIRPGVCKPPQKSPAPFVQMENIGNYLAASKKLGVGELDLFMTVDLFEEKNIGQVIRNLDTLRRIIGAGGSKSAPNVSVLSSSSSGPKSPPSFSSSGPKSASNGSVLSSSSNPRVPVGLREKENTRDEKKDFNAPICTLDQDVQQKLSTVGVGLEGELRNWIERITGEQFSDKSFGKSLKNGILLCQLANKIKPGICPKIQKSPAPFVQMENINAYLSAARQLGVPTADLFMTVDLFEEKNIGQVIRNLDTLRRVTGKF